MSWTDERVETAKRMWREGATATEIMVALGGGISRSAVLGKLHRLGVGKVRPAKRHQPVVEARPKGGQGRNGAVAMDRGGNPYDKIRRARAAAMNVPHETKVNGADQSACLPSSDPIAEEIAPAGPPGGISIEELTVDSCRFPLGPDSQLPPYQFCGVMVAPGSVYCPHHHARCYTGARPSRRAYHPGEGRSTVKRPGRDW